MSKQLKRDYIKNIGLLAYFLILGIERLLAVIFGFVQNNFFNGPFNSYTHIITLISLIGCFVIINKQFVYMIKAMITRSECDLIKLDYRKLAIGAGVILIGGMVHTTWTQLIVQFIAYAGMLLSMLIVILDNFHNKEDRLKLINNYIYIVSFAMAIPVAYKINGAHASLLEPLQCIASISLVTIYTFFLYTFYNNEGKIKAMDISFILLILFDMPIFILRLKETMNIFLVVFPAICLISLIINCIAYIDNNYCYNINNKDKEK